MSDGLLAGDLLRIKDSLDAVAIKHEAVVWNAIKLVKALEAKGIDFVEDEQAPGVCALKRLRNVLLGNDTETGDNAPKPSNIRNLRPSPRDGTTVRTDGR